MNDPDETLNMALGAVAGIVAVVIAGVTALAIATSRKGMSNPANEAAAIVAALCFEPGSDKLPLDAMDVLARVADAARAGQGSSVSVAAFRDTAGAVSDPSALAARRLATVRHALEADGVAPGVIAAGVHARSARNANETCRVELRLQ